MKAQDLKKSIFQYAMQGKLVSQNPNDESARVLLERIEAEKKQLIKLGKIKKEKALPPITEDEIPYEIPAHWEWIKFADLVNFNIGRTPERKDYTYWVNGKYNWVSIADLNDGKIISATKERVSQKAFDIAFRKQLAPKGTLLMSFKLTVGKVSILGMDACHNEAIISIFPFVDTDKIMTNFLFLGLPLFSQFGATKSAVKGNTLNTESMSNLLIPLPPLSEQKRIIEKLARFFPLIDEYAKNEEKLTELNDKLPNKLRQSIFQYAVEGKLVLQKPNDEPASILFERVKAEKEQLIKEGKIKRELSIAKISKKDIPYILPSNWKWCNLIDLAINIHYGYNGSANFNLKEPKLLRITDIQNNSVNWKTVPACDIATNTVETYKLQNNDILIARTGGTIGKSYLVEDLKYNAIFASYLIRVIPALNSYPKYIKLFIESPLYWTQIIEKSSGTGQPNVNGTSLKSLILPLPPLEEQKRIVAKVDELMKFCDELEEQIKNPILATKVLEKITEELSLVKKSNIIDITDEINRRAIFRAHVISKFKNKDKFGAIQCEKLTYLPEKILELPIGGNYEQQIAGPHDNDAKRKVDEIFKELKWVNVIDGNKSQNTRYIPDTNFAEHEELFDLCFGDKKTEIDNLLNLFKNKTSEECEAVATLYAVWNDLLIDKKPTSQEDIIECFYKWSAKKKNFNRQDLYENLTWMKYHNLIPTGKGQKTITKAKQTALF